MQRFPNSLNPPKIRFSRTTDSQNISASFWASLHTSSVWAVSTLFSIPQLLCHYFTNNWHI